MSLNPFEFFDLIVQMSLLVLLLLQCILLFFVLEFQVVKINNQLCVFFRLELNVVLCSGLVLGGIDSKLGDHVFHVLELFVQFFEGFRVSLLSVLLVCNLTEDVVLIELHNAGDVLLVVLSLDDLVDVLCELQNYSTLFFCHILLAFQICVVLVNLRSLFVDQLSYNS